MPVLKNSKHELFAQELAKIADTLDGMACNQLSENDEQTPADSLNQIAKDFRKYTESLNKGKSND